jgi:1-acyl-sn-glycerol-3-phosphate acyltransferase
MIAANKNDIFDAVLYIYFRWLTRKRFHTIAARGLDVLRNLPPDRPAILFCNHTNWWDGVLIYLLTREMRHKAGYCMMEEKQIKHYRFFTWLGAFSVDLSSPIRSAAALRYAQRLLEVNETAIVIFPQGQICRPNAMIEVKPGTEYLAKSAPQAVLVPMAMRYDFFREDRPNALIEIAEPFLGVDCTEGRIAHEVNECYARVNQSAREQDLSDFAPLFAPRLPLNKRWEWVKLLFSGRLREFTPTN